MSDYERQMFEGFMSFRDKLYTENIGGKKMYDVPTHYKWLDESELLTYYLDNVWRIKVENQVCPDCNGQKHFPDSTTTSGTRLCKRCWGTGYVSIVR